jgi:hypothetical protein
VGGYDKFYLHYCKDGADKPDSVYQVVIQGMASTLTVSR